MREKTKIETSAGPFDGIAEGDEDLATAWKRILVAEGEVAPDGGSLRDLVLGPPADV